WFYTLLISGLIGFDRSPYRRVLMHGWTLDEGGVAMHKSLGNIILPGEVIERYGRDALRLYELQSTPWDDLRFSWRGVKESLGTLQIMWNVFHFATLYMNLDGFDPRAHPLEGLWPDLGPEGRWLVSRLERLKRSVTEHLEGLHLHVALGDLVDFVLNDLSRWYVRLVRRHFWEERESATKLATYATLYYVLKNVLVLSAPFVPFIAEKIYQSAFRAVEGVESVHLMRWPEAREGWVDPDLEGEMEIVRRMVAGVLSARQKAGLKLRQPVASVTFVAERPEVADVARRYEGILRAQANARRVEAVGVDEEGRLRRIAASPVLSRIGPVFKRKARRVAELIEAADGEAMERAFGERGFFELRLDGEAVRILPEYVSFREEVAEGFVRGEFEGGRAYVDVRLTPELRAEGLSRDLVRRMQYMRKVLDLRVEEFVDAYVVAPVDLGPLRGFEGYIKQEVRARELTLSSGPAPWRADLEREWAIDGRPFTIGIRRLPSEA
ncbi:TPA: isoleucine--tRNA ligase, partial [Candidatus Bathyarchaeota archaeon]|nr:isoleucine--tRNA ligase [Candidatus Bathyarchaeota archaeon]